MLARAYFLLSSWIICFSLIMIPGVHIPYAILLLSTSYLLYATALAAIYLLPAAICFTGAASFAASLHVLLLYRKNGQKTQSISTTVFAVFSSVFTIVAPWAIRTTVRKMQQVLTREWEAIHEESTPLQPV